MVVVVVVQVVQVQTKGRDLSGCAEILGKSSEGEGEFGEVGRMQGKHILDGPSPA